MKSKIISYNKKPIDNEPNKQLFSFDVATTGAKNFLFTTYKTIYKIIISKQSHFYEDNTFSSGIKLFIDFDDKITFNTELERDLYANNIINTILSQINNKLDKEFNIKNTPVIILISDTLLKMSLHFVFPSIVFNTIYEIKFFMNDFSMIDHSVYKIGCFRMLYCSKMGKNNKLLFFDSLFYNKPSNDYELFLDSCICYTNNIKKLSIIIPTISKINNNNNNNNIKKNINKTSNISIKNNIKNNSYIYKNIDFNIINNTLTILKKSSNNYIEWLLVAFCMKDLYLSSNADEQIIIYDLFDNFSKYSSKYDKNNNQKIFMNLEPKVNINYLFKMSNENHHFFPFYNYQDIIFNPNNHKNIICKNEKYININLDIDFNKLLTFKFIFFKSPTGTGKTTFLKNIIKSSNINNIISITSRVNLASEHTSLYDLEFYLNLKSYQFLSCNKLVIQLESLNKCNYKNFFNGFVILDEINSILTHMRSPTMDNRRKDIYLYLIHIIKNAKYVVSLDADLADWNIDFLMEINKNDYFVYYNTNKNKINTNAIFYKSPQVLINIMNKHIQNNIFFVSCFDSLKHMNNIINYLAQFNDKNNWLIYSSEINYKLINTKLWINKFVFFTPTILYGIDFNHDHVDVFSFVFKNHLNPLQIYQMISRSRKQNNVHVFCNQKEFHVKYNSIDDVIHETSLYEKNFSSILPSYKNYIDINDKPYRIMYYNFKFIDSILKTNIKDYLVDIMINKGYNIQFNNNFITDKINNKNISIKTIKNNIINLLNLDLNKLSDFELLIVSNDKLLEKHFNLRLLLNNNINDKLIDSIHDNLFLETIKNKYTKIKICKNIMNLLHINDLSSINKNISVHFNDIIEDLWIKDNIHIIKKTFNIRTNKYNHFTFYNIYLLLITILNNLFDSKLFIKKIIHINKVKYSFYLLNNDELLKHTSLINNNNNYDFNNFVFD